MAIAKIFVILGKKETSYVVPMWHFISDHITRATDALFVCQSRTQVQDSTTRSCYIIHDDTRRFFVKVASQLPATLLRCEADGLKAIAQTQSINTPHIVCYGVTEHGGSPVEYLVLQHVRILKNEGLWFELGAQVAAMHQQQQEADRYGWNDDNYIGATAQKNTWNDSWASFFAEMRIGHMLELLAQQNVKITDIDDLVASITTFLAGHQPPRSLLHGDLWSGNAAFCKRGPLVFDPAVYIGDRETDIAMSELFGGFNSAFYEGYNEKWALPADYPARRPLYQLYHLLNHALLFKEPYLSSAKSVIIDFQQQR